MRIMLVGKDSICRIGVEHILKRGGVDLDVFEEAATAMEAVGSGASDWGHIVWVGFTCDAGEIVGLVKLKSAAGNIPLIAHFQHITPSIGLALAEADIAVFVDEPEAAPDFVELMSKTGEGFR